jgi:RimJ/RimL family protein N-acetyltransferase
LTITLLRNEVKEKRRMNFKTNIETERLFLRKPTIEDANAIFKNYAQDKDVTKYLTWIPHKSFETTKSFLEWCLKRADNGNHFPFVILLKNTYTLIGMIDFSIEDHKACFGYVLTKDYWNKGYMSEALKILTNELLKTEEIFRVWAVCDIENNASMRVMEKAGMEYEGILKRWLVNPNISKIPRDCHVYAKVK